MTGAAKRNGDKAEREASALIYVQTGFPARRKLGAGRLDDEGDIEGVPDTMVQVADGRDITHAARVKPDQANQQRANAGNTFAASFIRLQGGEYRVVLTVGQWATLLREPLA